MSATTCSFHPDKIAVTICERCHRPICLEDKRIYRRTHYSNNNFGSNNYGSSSYVTTHEYCPLCYASQKKTNVTSSLIGGGIFIIFLLFGVGMFLSFTNSMTSSFNSNMPGQSGMMTGFSAFSGLFILVIIVMVIFVVGGIVYAKMQADEAVDEAVNFKRSLNTSYDNTNRYSSFKQSTKPLYQKRRDISTINCFECGSAISINDQFCPSCGNDTKDEIRAFTNAD